MKVKELVEILLKLDQEKNIKTVIASGYEYDEITGEPEVNKYEDLRNVENYHNLMVEFDDPDFKDRDFYVLT